MLGMVLARVLRMNLGLPDTKCKWIIKLLSLHALMFLLHRSNSTNSDATYPWSPQFVLGSLCLSQPHLFLKVCHVGARDQESGPYVGTLRWESGHRTTNFSAVGAVCCFRVSISCTKFHSLEDHGLYSYISAVVWRAGTCRRWV